MKTCSQCGATKERSEFYRHVLMADGLEGKCKTCRAANALARHDGAPRPAVPPPRRASSAELTRDWRRAHPDRNAAGRIARRTHRKAPDSCQRCGLTGEVERHHPNYEHPTIIEWLCGPCHGVADKERRAREN